MEPHNSIFAKIRGARFAPPMGAMPPPPPYSRYKTVPRPNRRATVYFGTQLISVGCIGPTSKKYQCGPCQPSRFFSGKSRFFTRNVPLKTLSRLAGLERQLFITVHAAQKDRLLSAARMTTHAFSHILWQWKYNGIGSASYQRRRSHVDTAVG